MKNATEYGKRIKGILPSLKKKHAVEPTPPVSDPLSLFVLAMLHENAPADVAAGNLERLSSEFVDFNELRVAPYKDIVELLEGDPTDLRAKAARITDGLNRIFDQNNKLDFEHAADMGKRDLRTHLSETLGFSSYVEAYLLAHLFGHRAVPVDDTLVERLKAEDLAGPDAGVDDVRAVLERVVPARDQAEVAEVLSAWAQQPPPAGAAKAKKRGGRTTRKSAGKKTGKKRKKKKASKATKALKKNSAKKKAKTTTKKAAVRKKKTARKTTKTKRK
ncbi:MAG: hypothetical protein ACOC7R_04320 [Planctomycetota bacterium]